MLGRGCFVAGDPTQVKTSQLYLFLGLGSLGLLSGYAGKQLAAPDVVAADQVLDADVAAESRSRQSRPDGPGPKRSRGKVDHIDTSHIQSADTLESLKNVPPDELYARLAVWMIDASEEEVRAYWDHYRTVENRSNEINDLIFINWTRIDPRAATAAAAGTPDEHYAWWAWSSHDPAGSLAAVIAENPDRLNNVTWGLGEFHPDWVMAHWDEIPEGGQGNALNGLSKWDDVANPLEIITFLKDHGRGFHSGLFRVLIKKDPWAAYAYLQENGDAVNDPFDSSRGMREFVAEVGRENPEMLEQLAAQTPSGAMKRQMESSQFKALLSSDPQAAKQQALETTSIRIAEERLSAVGLSLISSKPEEAFAMAEAMFAINPNAADRYSSRSSTGSDGIVYSVGSDSADVDNFVNALVANDPQRVIEMGLAGNREEGLSPGFDNISRKWIDQDLQGYTEWLGKQTDPQVLNSGADQVIRKLRNEQNFADAAEWVVSVKGDGGHDLTGLVADWSYFNPEEARQWIDNSDLSVEAIDKIEQQMESRR